MRMKIKLAGNTTLVNNGKEYGPGHELEVAADLGAALIKGGSAELVTVQPAARDKVDG